MPRTCRVIIDDPASGAWNMAVDEALLESAAEGGPPTLRFYRWSEPTLSLGYFQPHATRASHAASRDLPVVRRSSGGGALVHDAELTYSLTLPPSDPRSRDAIELTCGAHRALIAALEDVCDGALRLTTCSAAIVRDPADEPFLCFQRRSEGDLVGPDGLGRLHKVCGSAQRRRRLALLQHGGVLLAQSRHAPELPGLREILNHEVDPAALTDGWRRKLLEWLDLDAEQQTLTNTESTAAQALAEDRFGGADWTKRR